MSDEGTSEAAATESNFADAIKEIGDKLVGLTLLKEAKNLERLPEGRARHRAGRRWRRGDDGRPGR